MDIGSGVKMGDIDLNMNSLLSKTTNEMGRTGMTHESRHTKSISVSARTTNTANLYPSKLPSIDRAASRSCTSTSTPLPSAKGISVNGNRSLITNAFKMACLA